MQHSLHGISLVVLCTAPLLGLYSSVEMSRYTIAEVGDLVVAHQDNEVLGECSEFSGGGTTIGAYAAGLRR